MNSTDFQGYPPARQARVSSLPGCRGEDRFNDLPPVPQMRRLAGPIETATIITALVALAIFVLPLVRG